MECRCSSTCWSPWMARGWPRRRCRRPRTWRGHLGASVTLIHIIERDASGEIHGERHLTTPDEAAATWPRSPTAPSRRSRRSSATSTPSARPTSPQSIVDHVEELAPDLIIMCTHGSSGLRDLLFGSIAQQVIARGTVPVLLIRPKVAAAQERWTVGRILRTVGRRSGARTGVVRSRRTGARVPRPGAPGFRRAHARHTLGAAGRDAASAARRHPRRPRPGAAGCRRVSAPAAWPVCRPRGWRSRPSAVAGPHRGHCGGGARRRRRHDRAGHARQDRHGRVLGGQRQPQALRPCRAAVVAGARGRAQRITESI